MSRERHLRMSARTLPLVAVLLLWSLFLPGLGNALAEDNMQTYLCEDNTVGDMVNHPNLAAFGRHLLPGTMWEGSCPGTVTCSPGLSLMQ